MKKIIAAVIIVAVLAGGWYGFTLYRARQQAAMLSDLQTVTASRGGLTATVGATGIVHANQSTLITWQTSGLVENVGFESGDAVQAAQELAKLSQTSLPQNVILAHADLLNAQQALDNLYDTDLALAQAEQEVLNAEDAVKDAQYYVDSLESGSRQSDIDSAEASVMLAQISLDKARDKYNPFRNKADTNILKATYYNRLTEAQQNYDAAVRRLNNLKGTPSELTFDMADADLHLAQARLQDANDNLTDLRNGPDENDVAAAEARIAAAQAILDTAVLTAPFDGTLTSVLIKPGDRVAPGSAAFQLDDLSHLLVDVQVSEVDVNRIKIGQDVLLTFDAILGQEYQGKVTDVALIGSSNQGVVDFTVTVELINPDENVRPGMTAAVNIVVRELEDVLLVPNWAVRLQEGQRVVYILQEGMPTPVNIQLGASSETYSEVVGGDLKAGDEIVLNPPTVFDQNGPPPFVQR